jgi:SRSO17 transposase
VDRRSGPVPRGGDPDWTAFATKPKLARVMIGRALDAGTPAGWVTADETSDAI